MVSPCRVLESYPRLNFFFFFFQCLLGGPGHPVEPSLLVFSLLFLAGVSVSNTQVRDSSQVALGWFGGTFAFGSVVYRYHRFLQKDSSLVFPSPPPPNY